MNKVHPFRTPNENLHHKHVLNKSKGSHGSISQSSQVWLKKKNPQPKQVWIKKENFQMTALRKKDNSQKQIWRNKATSKQNKVWVKKEKPQIPTKSSVRKEKQVFNLIDFFTDSKVEIEKKKYEISKKEWRPKKINKPQNVLLTKYVVKGTNANGPIPKVPVSIPTLQDLHNILTPKVVQEQSEEQFQSFWRTLTREHIQEFVLTLFKRNYTNVDDVYDSDEEETIVMV